MATLWEKKLAHDSYSMNVYLNFQLGCFRRPAKTLKFCNISVITEDVYVKLGICVHYPKSNPYDQGRQFKLHFFQNYAPFST